jgi:hypothetical protein
MTDTTTTTHATAAPQVTGRSLLITWAADKDDWVREVVARVLETSSELGEEDVEMAFHRMLVEKGLKEGEKPAGATLVDRPTSGANEPPLTLLSIENVKNVNALALGQIISFNIKMTVIFGRNGSGKTGYARILKRLSSVRAEQRILPDITAARPVTDPPSATICYSLGGTTTTVEWKGAAGLAPFTRVDVFDAQDAPTYVDGDLTYVYAPTDVALFRHVAKAIDAVRTKLEAARKEKSPGLNVFGGHFKRSAPFYTAIDTLGASTDLSAVKQHAVEQSDEAAVLEGLKVTIDALSDQSVSGQVVAAQAELDLCEHARTALEGFRSFDPRGRDELLAKLRSAEERRSSAGRAAFESEHLPGLMTAEWKAFVEAGDQYAESLGAGEYPKEDDACLYCRQPLNQRALTLFQKYREFCRGEVERCVVKARAELDDLVRPVANLDLRGLQEGLKRNARATVVDEGTSIGADAKTVLEHVSRLKDALSRPEPFGDSIVMGDADAVFARLSSAQTSCRDRLKALKGKGEDRMKALAEAKAKKEELEARATLRGLLPSIEAFVTKSKWESVAHGVLRRLKTIAKALTDTSKQASERLVNQDFERYFRAECGSLNAPHVNLDFKGHKGAAARRKQLRPEYRLTESLSEGEQKVIALADFLAEARLRTTNAPVVFDDPVTSLDYERIREVASRLAGLAQERQVVVFTHNIWFAVELLERFRDRRTDCAYYDVRALESQRGVVSGGTHPRSDSWSDLKRRINTTLSEARKQSGETQDALVFRGYSILRALCEVGVESELFHGVVRRYEPNVRLTVLPEIKPVAMQAACKVIHPVYEEACRYIEAHSQPLEHLNVVRTVDELEKDFKAVVDAVDTYKKAL